MGSMVAASGKLEELKEWAEQMGMILCKKTFGEHGPDLQTSLAELEELLEPLLGQMAAGFLKSSVAHQGRRLPDELACPTCGVGCAALAESRERTTTTEHGDFVWEEPSCFCDRCQRSFFPSASGAQD